MSFTPNIFFRQIFSAGCPVKSEAGFSPTTIERERDFSVDVKAVLLYWVFFALNMNETVEIVTKLLYEATRRRLIVSLRLDNEPDARIVHPYGVCQTNRDKIMVICWQEAGYAGTSRLPGYRNLSLARCSTVELLDRYFLVRSDFNPADSSYQEWVFHVS